MPRRDPHPHRSDPESTFDTWLDAFVAGTPAGAASRDVGTGPLARAQAGARQLHGLATRSAMPGAAARQTIEEDLMQRGALAATRGGSTWIPEERREKRVSWWSPASPVLATAMAIAVMLALLGLLIWTQRPVLSPTPDGNPGFAVASPVASSESKAQVSDLLIVRGLPADEAQALSDRVGVIDDDGLIIYQPDGTIKLDGASEVIPTGVPGQALVTWLGGQRTVVDLTTGKNLFELPDMAERESFANPYLFVSESGENADWMIYDLRNGESLPLSEIVDLPADQPAVPVQSGPLGGPFSEAVYMHFVSPEYEVSPTSDIPRFVIVGSLDSAMTLDGYPPATQAVSHHPVVSSDRETVAWITSEPDSAIIIAEAATGDELARIDVDELGPGAQLTGFTEDGESLVVTTFDRIRTFNWAGDEAEERIIVEGLADVSSPLFHAPSGSLYFIEHWTLNRMTIPDGDMSIVDPVLSPRSLRLVDSESPWIIAAQGGNAALIDARTGEIVSELSDVPPNKAEFDAVSTSASLDGSVVIQEIGGSNSGYLVAPQFPNGLVLTAPIDPEVIAESEAPDGIPVKYTLSADGSTVVAGTIGEDGYAPQFMAPVEPDPEWTPIPSGVDNLYWIPMPKVDAGDDDAETLPALDIATQVATPEYAQVPTGLYVVSGKSDINAENVDLAIATLGEDGLTLPVAGDGTVTISNVVDVGYNGAPDQALITREDDSRAVIDLVTGDILFEVPPITAWEQDFTPYRMLPANEDLTDWEIIDLRTGDTRLLSDIVELPDGTSVRPSPVGGGEAVGDAGVFEVEEGRIDGGNFVVSSPDSSVFVIPGALDRAVSIPDYPTDRALAGSPAMAVREDGGIIAYETRAGDDRIVILDAATGEEIVRFGVTAVGEDPELAGFTEDGDHVVVTRDDRVMLLNWRGDPPFTVMDDLEDIAYPLLYVPDAILYVKQTDALLRIDLPAGEVTEVATGLVPGRLEFTVPGSPWITFYGQDGQALLDARTGEIVSRMKPPSPSQLIHFGGAWASGDGDTFIFATEPPPSARSAWLLSPEYPDGLKLTVPADTGNFTFNLSPDGEFVYAKDKGYSGPGDLWVTPLTAEPEWQLVGEDVDIEARFFLNADGAGDRALPALDVATPATNKDLTSIEVMAADDIYVSVVADGVPVFEGELAAGESTGPIDGVQFEVYTTSGANTLFATAFGSEPFNMGYEPGEAYYILSPDAATVHMPVSAPAQSTPADGTYVTSIDVAAKDDIYVSVLADGVPVFEGDLAAGETTGQIEGSRFEVYTSSGANTVFTNACDSSPFNMGFEPGEAYYILEANEGSCPPAASPVATPATTGGPASLTLVEGGAENARFASELAIAILGEDGQTVSPRVSIVA